MDCSFDFLDVPLGFLVGLVLVLFQFGMILFFHFFLHPGLINFNSVFFFLEELFKSRTIILPLIELQLIFGRFLLGLTHFAQVFIKLRDLHISVLHLLLMRLIDFLILSLVIFNCFSFSLFILLLPSSNLLLQVNLSLHLFFILPGQINNYILPFLHLVLEVVVERFNFLMSISKVISK